MFSSYTATTFILTFLSSKKINKDNKKEKEKEKKMEEKEKILSVLFSTFSFFLYYVEWSRRKTEFTKPESSSVVSGRERTMENFKLKCLAEVIYENHSIYACNSNHIYLNKFTAKFE